MSPIIILPSHPFFSFHVVAPLTRSISSTPSLLPPCSSFDYHQPHQLILFLHPGRACPSPSSLTDHLILHRPRKSLIQLLNHRLPRWSSPTACHFRLITSSTCSAVFLHWPRSPAPFSGDYSSCCFTVSSWLSLVLAAAIVLIAWHHSQSPLLLHLVAVQRSLLLLCILFCSACFSCSIVVAVADVVQLRRPLLRWQGRAASIFFLPLRRASTFR